MKLQSGRFEFISVSILTLILTANVYAQRPLDVDYIMDGNEFARNSKKVKLYDKIWSLHAESNNHPSSQRQIEIQGEIQDLENEIRNFEQQNSPARTEVYQNPANVAPDSVAPSRKSSSGNAPVERIPVQSISQDGLLRALSDGVSQMSAEPAPTDYQSQSLGDREKKIQADTNWAVHPRSVIEVVRILNGATGRLEDTRVVQMINSGRLSASFMATAYEFVVTDDMLVRLAELLTKEFEYTADKSRNPNRMTDALILVGVNEDAKKWVNSKVLTASVEPLIRPLIRQKMTSETYVYFLLLKLKGEDVLNVVKRLDQYTKGKYGAKHSVVPAFLRETSELAMRFLLPPKDSLGYLKEVAKIAKLAKKENLKPGFIGPTRHLVPGSTCASLFN